ncbi:MAG: glycosyl transferase, partial [Rhodoferax sp.]
GLYRRSAIEAAGYFSDRNLHSYEEFDLAVRLRSLSWLLWRLPVDAASHFGHDAPPYRLLMRRWRSRYVCGMGELLRAAVGEPHIHLVLRGLREFYLYMFVFVWWAVLISVPFWPMSIPFRVACFFALAIAPVLLMTWRKRSITKALYSVVSWCFNAAGLIRGLVCAQRPARETISSMVLQEPADLSSRPTSGTFH